VLQLYSFIRGHEVKSELGVNEPIRTRFSVAVLQQYAIVLLQISTYKFITNIVFVLYYNHSKIIKILSGKKVAQLL
jgi:hypothetical protein